MSPFVPYWTAGRPAMYQTPVLGRNTAMLLWPEPVKSRMWTGGAGVEAQPTIAGFVRAAAWTAVADPRADAVEDDGAPAAEAAVTGAATAATPRATASRRAASRRAARPGVDTPWEKFQRRSRGDGAARRRQWSGRPIRGDAL